MIKPYNPELNKPTTGCFTLEIRKLTKEEAMLPIDDLLSKWKAESVVKAGDQVGEVQEINGQLVLF
jgi:hypothetical protein